MNRGLLTESVKSVSKKVLGYKIDDVDELRLMPYMDYVMKNTQRMDIRKINKEDEQGWIKSGVSHKGGRPKISKGEKITITKEFYDAMQEILWISYVKENENG